MENERIEKIAISYLGVANSLAKELTVSTICEILEIDKSEYDYLVHYPAVVARLQVRFAKELIYEIEGEF